MTFVKNVFNYTLLPIILMAVTMMLLPVLLFTDEVSVLQELMSRIFNPINERGH